jgi:type III pantothenate kinase
MLLAIDIGNSEITIGIWHLDRWVHHWRLPSRIDQPELYYNIKIRDRFFESAIPVDNITQIIMSSVVPGLTRRIENVVISLLERKPVILNQEVYRKLPVEVLNPHEIGSDLVANAIAAYTKFGKTSIVVDFGTALTFTTVSGQGVMLGVSIAPGLQTAIRSLSQNTAKLFDVPLEMPASALGKNTVTAIQSGILLGYEGMVRSVVGHIRNELKTDCMAIATGGLSSVITTLGDFFDATEPRLTLDGLRIVGDILGEE